MEKQVALISLFPQRIHRGVGAWLYQDADQCIQAGLPEPLYDYDMSGFWVVFRKDIYYEEYLAGLGLNARQIKAALFAKSSGRISNKDYQEINSVSKRTASNELSELANHYKILIKSGSHGAAVLYKPIGQ